jgi:ribonucleoside-diphosphate reductase alpha chain
MLSDDFTKSLDLQKASRDVWTNKYALKSGNGTFIDNNVQDTYKRVAKTLSYIEETTALRKRWYMKFLWALNYGAIPAGRILANAGSGCHKHATSAINCTVSGIIKDSMDDILNKLHESGLTLKAGCGIGYEFSTLRPQGAFVAGAGSNTSGPLSFMDIYDKMCFTVSSAGGRRGAQMATFDISHPDVLDFICAKRENGRLRQFNLSLLITSSFIKAVEENLIWHLSFPILNDKNHIALINFQDSKKVLWRDWPFHDDKYFINDKGLVACRIYHSIKARKLWDIIMSATYNYAEPGFILIDKVNEENNNWFCENINVTNPCGEQPLPPYGSCLLGSINLTKFVQNPFKRNVFFDWHSYRRVIRVFTRMLDNVIEINGLPLKQQSKEIRFKRRHGMGFLGLGSALTMLRIRYGDIQSVLFTEEISRLMALEGWREGLYLSKEKNTAPIFNKSYKITQTHLNLRSDMKKKGFLLNDIVSSKILFTEYSHYMRRIATEDSKLVHCLSKYGCRFTHHSSIAPTGTIALSLANNASNGIEPSFAHYYSRNIILSNKKTKAKIDVFSYEMLVYRTLVDSISIKSISNNSDLPNYFATADLISPKKHVNIQSSAQKWIDSGISKTINIPRDMLFSQFKSIYLYSYYKDLKGCTTFRFDPENFQGVLVKNNDLKDILYCFTLSDGEKLYFKGDDIVNYDKEEHTVANLYDALKEGYYGKL